MGMGVTFFQPGAKRSLKMRMKSVKNKLASLPSPPCHGFGFPGLYIGFLTHYWGNGCPGFILFFIALIAVGAYLKPQNGKRRRNIFITFP